MGQLQQQQQQKPEMQELSADTEVNNVVNPRPPLSTHQDNPSIVRLRQRPAVVQSRPPLIGSMPMSCSASPVEAKPSVLTDQKPSEPHWLKQVTNRAHVAISSVLGQPVRRYDDLTPPGLRNPGQNICFLNSIIQAIAHTPCLPEAVLQLRTQNPADQLVRYLADLLEQLVTPMPSNVPLVLDTGRFRTQAALEFAGGLIQRPFQMPQQRQQDAAECLSWLIEWLHYRMNSVSLHGTAVSSVQPLGIHCHLFTFHSAFNKVLKSPV